MPCPEKFRQAMEKYGVTEVVQAEVAQGYENIVSSSPKKVRAEYFTRAMDILDASVEQGTKVTLMDFCGCCKSGAREKNSRAFAKENKDKTLEEKLALIVNVPNIGRPKLTDDGRIYIDAIRFNDGKRYLCACPNFNDLKDTSHISKSYCLCCAGHFRFHYQLMLGLKLQLAEVVSSPLGSDGTEFCAFLFEIVG